MNIYPTLSGIQTDLWMDGWIDNLMEGKELRIEGANTLRMNVPGKVPGPICFGGETSEVQNSTILLEHSHLGVNWPENKNLNLT